MRRVNKFNEMNKRISNLGKASAKRMEYDLTHRFSFAWDTSYTNLDGETVATTLGDGLAFMSAAHTATGSATTFRNFVANNPALSKAGLEGAEKLFATQMIDSNGETIFPQPDTLITTNDPNTVNTALEYLKSYSDPNAGHEGVMNQYYGRYRHVALPYLSTDANGVYDSAKAGYWFLVCLEEKDSVLKVLSAPRMIPEGKYSDKEFDTMDWLFGSHAAYRAEIVRPHWAVGSKGDGTA